MLHLNASLLFLVCISFQVNGDVNHIVLMHEHHPDRCYLETDNDSLLIDSDTLVRYPGRCANIYCGRDSWALIFTCKTPIAPDGCVLGDYINTKAAYPECCERDWKCNNIL